MFPFTPARHLPSGSVRKGADGARWISDGKKWHPTRCRVQKHPHSRISIRANQIIKTIIDGHPRPSKYVNVIRINSDIGIYNSHVMGDWCDTNLYYNALRPKFDDENRIFTVRGVVGTRNVRFSAKLYFTELGWKKFIKIFK